MAYISMSHRPQPFHPSEMPAAQAIPLDELSERLQLSRQTLVRWVDRHLVEATLEWMLNDANEEVRVIKLTPEALTHLRTFASDYRDDVVTPTQARRILKVIDRKQVKRMIRAKDVTTVEIEGEKRIVVGSIEDYLRSQETVEA